MSNEPIIITPNDDGTFTIKGEIVPWPPDLPAPPPPEPEPEPIPEPEPEPEPVMQVNTTMKRFLANTVNEQDTFRLEVTNVSQFRQRVTMELHGRPHYSLLWGDDPWEFDPGETMPVMVAYKPQAYAPEHQGHLVLSTQHDMVTVHFQGEIAIQPDETSDETTHPEPTPDPPDVPPLPDPPPDVDLSDTYPGTLMHTINPRPNERPPKGQRPEPPSKPAEVTYVGMASQRHIEVELVNRNVYTFSSTDDWWDRGKDSIRGDQGPALEKGKWIVEDQRGRPLSIKGVTRYSTPKNQNWFEPGPGGQTHINLMDVVHTLWIELSDAPKPLSELTIISPLGGTINLDPANSTTRSVQLNQVGYAPQSKMRYAYISNWMGGPAVHAGDLPITGTIVGKNFQETIPLKISKVDDKVAGGTVYEVDLRSVPASDSPYRIVLAGMGSSRPFYVNAYGPLKSFYKTARGLYFNRWGRDLKMPYCDWPQRPPDHPTVYTDDSHNQTNKRFPSPRPTNRPRPLTGGHHDAGDFDIWIYHYQVGLLLMGLYEVNPQAFTKSQLDIPIEADLPDILGEADYSLKGWLQLQDKDGSVRPGVESTRHPVGRQFADENQDKYWTYAKRADHTARACGLFAQMARLCRQHQAMGAGNLYAAAAERAYKWAAANGAKTTLGPWLLANGAMARLTGVSSYKEEFERVWGNGQPVLHTTPWRGIYKEKQQNPMMEYLIDYCLTPGAQPGIISTLEARLGKERSNVIKTIMGHHGHRNARTNMKPEWGRGTAMGYYILPIVNYHRLRQEPLSQESIDALSLCADFTLGCNPAGFSYITGLGYNYPTNALHNDSLAYIGHGEHPMDGIPVYGFVEDFKDHAGYEFQDRVAYPDHKKIPLSRRYTDVWTNVNCNEFDILIQTMQTYILGCLLTPGVTSVPQDWRPGQPKHRRTVL